MEPIMSLNSSPAHFSTQLFLFFQPLGLLGFTAFRTERISKWEQGEKIKKKSIWITVCNERIVAGTMLYIMDVHNWQSTWIIQNAQDERGAWPQAPLLRDQCFSHETLRHRSQLWARSYFVEVNVKRTTSDAVMTYLCSLTVKHRRSIF